jgi:hypothetical protein
MSTSLLYHCFGITGRGIHHVRSRFEEGRTIFRIAQDPTTPACSACGSRKVRKKVIVHREPPGMGATSGDPVFRALCTRAISRRFFQSLLTGVEERDLGSSP